MFVVAVCELHAGFKSFVNREGTDCHVHSMESTQICEFVLVHMLEIYNFKISRVNCPEISERHGFQERKTAHQNKNRECMDHGEQVTRTQFIVLPHFR